MSIVWLDVSKYIICLRGVVLPHSRVFATHVALWATRVDTVRIVVPMPTYVPSTIAGIMVRDVYEWSYIGIVRPHRHTMGTGIPDFVQMVLTHVFVWFFYG